MCKRANEIKGREEQRSAGPRGRYVGVWGYAKNISVKDRVTRHPRGLEWGAGGGCQWVYLQEGPSQSPKAALPGWVWEQLRSGTRCVHGKVFLEHTGAPASCAHKGFSSVHTRICVISETRRVSSEPRAWLVAGASPPSEGRALGLPPTPVLGAWCSWGPRQSGERAESQPGPESRAGCGSWEGRARLGLKRRSQPLKLQGEEAVRPMGIG